MSWCGMYQFVSSPPRRPDVMYEGAMDDVEQKFVLIVEDDADLRELLANLLDQAGIANEAVGTLCRASARIREISPALVLLDVMMPDGDGLAFCAQLRQAGFANKIMMLTAKGAALDRIAGLEGGADDYLTKPFESRELLARIRNLLRGATAWHSISTGKIRYARFGTWRLDLVQRRLVTSDDRIVMVSTGEFDLLRRMIDAPRIELSREDLMPERRETVHFDRSLDNRISRLRNKLGAERDGAQLIVTVRNRGFMLAADVSYE
ncbi:response regulator transcription factor [Novosphingobium humi]